MNIFLPASVFFFDNFHIFAYMVIRLTTYYHSKDIPDLPGTNIFHSTELFRVLEQTPGYSPVLLVAFIENKSVGKLLCTTRRNLRLIGFTNITYIYGTGEYFNPPIKKEEIFNELLTYFTNRFKDKSFLLEFRNIETPLFGYRYFRQNNYFPIKWLRVRNSIHQHNLGKWMSASRRRQIANGLKNGATANVAQNENDIREFFSSMKKYYSSKLHKYFPDVKFFLSLLSQPSKKELGQIFLVKHEKKIIGGSVCVYSNDTAYLLFSGGMRKSYPRLYPGVLAVWYAMIYAQKQNYKHFEFIDAGLPFHKYGYRDFILRFGGKQLSSRRWFHIRWNWLNRLFIHIYV